MTIFGSVKTSCFESFLISKGCSGPIDAKGSHVKYKCPNCKRPIMMRQFKTIPEFHIRTNLKSLDTSVTEFIEYMEKYC